MRDIAFVALGSNLGHREMHLASAIEALARLPESRLLATSRVDETAPLGGMAQPPYLNQMVAIETSLDPQSLLDALHRIEVENGRVRGERWTPRTLDLDIVCFESGAVVLPNLVAPHPGLPDRPFWQRELAELRAALDCVRRSRLPAWARISTRRCDHVARVVAVLERWGTSMAIPDDERQQWIDAGWWHDALRDADETELRELVPDGGAWVEMLHGPAAAVRLEAQGESRRDVLEAVRWHTVGCATWARTGRALYMADFLEPGRPFARADRAFLARQVPHDFDGVFRQVVRERIAWTIREGKVLFPETVTLWNALR